MEQLLQKAAQALRDAARYGAGDWSELVDALESQASSASVPADAARFNDGWTHPCNALCMEIALWIERCPHCGRPAPKAPAMQEEP